MNTFVNAEMKRILRSGRDAAAQVRLFMQEMWRGGKLLLACLGDGCAMPIRMQGVQCLAAFASQEAADLFSRMMQERGGPVLMFREETAEAVLGAALEGGLGLAVEAGAEDCLILPMHILEGMKKLTQEITGGVMPEEDLPLMRLHLGTVGNGERVKKAVNCGCYRCRTIFPAAEVVAGMAEADGSRTALCPRCGTDAVLTDDECMVTGRLLQQMRDRFFGETGEEDAGLRMVYLECMKERVKNSAKV